MKLYYDFYIYLLFFLCVDNDMMLYNIINMVKIKGLDVILVIDYNFILNFESFLEVVNLFDILFIFGVEIEIEEEIYVLLYFKYKDVLIIREF